MKKENVIKPTQDDHHDLTEESPLMSDDLQKAIQTLIYRLRELGPLSK